VIPVLTVVELESSVVIAALRRRRRAVHLSEGFPVRTEASGAAS